MNERCWLLAGVLVVCGAVGGRAEAETAKKSDAPNWLRDLDEGRKTARAAGKPLFVVFRCEH